MLSAKDFIDYGLPEDAYGVHVSDEIDALKLRYVVAQVGEAKLRRHADMYAAKWSGSKPFISRIIKTFRVAVPPSVYRGERAKIWGVYVLVPVGVECLKIGHTSNFVKRACNIFNSLWWHGAEQLPKYYDMDLSVFFQCGERGSARALESELLAMTKDYKSSPPSRASFSGAAPTEWRDISRYPAIKALCFAHPQIQTSMTLVEAVQYAEALSSPQTDFSQ